MRVDAAAAITSDTGPVVVSAGLLESVAVTVREAVAAVVGVPEIVQLVILRPPGSGVLGDRTQVYGAVPPLTPMSPVYGELTVPAERRAQCQR